MGARGGEAFAGALRGAQTERVVIEVTEHTPVEDPHVVEAHR